MKVLKIILLTILIIVAIPLILGLFVEKEFLVEREIIINKPKAEVFNHVRSLKNQDQFSVWAQKDPDMETTYTGTDGEVGFVSAWESEDENVGKGSQEITKIVENERVETKLRFLEPFNSESDAQFVAQSITDNSTKVTWEISGEFSYPMNSMLFIYDMDGAMGEDLEIGLQNLKNQLEI